MNRIFQRRKQQALLVGLTLERDRRGDHPYCLWFNSPSGSKEIWIKNLREEFDQAFSELTNIKTSETDLIAINT